MPTVGNIPDIRQNIIETARQQRRTENASIAQGEKKSGREAVKEGFYKYENVRGAFRSAIKEEALRNIKGEDVTRAEQDARAKQAKLNITRERRHDALREKFIEEEGKGTGISVTA